MQTVIDGMGLSFDKKGKKGRSVLLMHGWGQNKEMMDFIAEFLSAHFTVYNFDLPGFGGERMLLPARCGSARASRCGCVCS